ncbi:unnamed protein product [Triticum turgidum subsp. durum]|uniref:F-box domain-containing protein n=1 Tax=Triticum turgidum subsp. durum TaxID=4567 RepID=A0A9R0V9K8_TRITD|nr:unnamed protein product [Triticum turgidum subsp. durum]
MNASEDGARRRRRSQTHDEADGVARLHPQVHAGEEGAGVARGRRTRPRARPRSQIHATGEGAGVICCVSIPAALASPFEDDDLLREILLRLPPQPSSLLRASAVCKQWRCAATDPKFLHRFRTHHRKPPLLGVFHVRNRDDIVFTPILDAPDRIPPQRFDLISSTEVVLLLLDCRHGRVLLIDVKRDEAIVSTPITGEQRHLPIPSEFEFTDDVNGAVLCAASDHDHVHGSCHSSPFKVVLISDVGEDNRFFACVYSSETGVWSDIISTAVPPVTFCADTPGVLVGNALYWLMDFMTDDILEFDLDQQSLAVIKGPPITDDFRHASHWIVQAEDGAVGFAILTCSHLQMWQRIINVHGVATWVLWKTIDMHTIHGLPPQIEGEKTHMIRIAGCIEDTDGIYLFVGCDVYMVQLNSMQSRKLCENRGYTYYHSFKSFYPPDRRAYSLLRCRSV